MLEMEELLEKLESTTDSDLLDEYADYDDKEVRFTVALSFSTSKETMFRRLYYEKDKEIQELWRKKHVKWYRNKKHHIDAKLGDETVRFYPRKSCVHGFHSECPTSWDHYYKEYLAFSILYQDEFMKEENEAPKIVFECLTDECSSLLDLNIVLYLWLSETEYKNKAKLTKIILKRDAAIDGGLTLLTMGYGTEWKLKRELKSFWSDRLDEDGNCVKTKKYLYTIIPYLNYGPQKAYVLKLDDAMLLVLNNALTDYLDECMKNSESI